VRPDINVTPLVDVVLVLLIIFMVVAPRMDQDVQVDLPGIFNPDPEVKIAVDPVKVSVAHAGEYYVNEQRYDLDGLIEMLANEHAAEPLRRLVLRADSRLTYGQVREVLARSQQIGFPGLSFMVGERHRPGAQPAAANAVANTGAPDGTVAPPPASEPGSQRDTAPKPDAAHAAGPATGSEG
jgi:biopolymer transport protein ExbD/biopolymer transport protein TolR